MDDELVFIFESFLRLYRLYKARKKTRRVRRWSVRPINRDRISRGYFKAVFLKMKRDDEEQFFLHTRMSNDIFDLLLDMMRHYLEGYKRQIYAQERLSITLMHLALGISFRNIAETHKLGKTTVRNIVLETCELLWAVLSPIYVSEPNNSQYSDIAEDFRNIWNIPNCVGAIDGKHIAIMCPRNSGSLFYNYKKFYSIILMASCDAKYTFTSANVGCCGSQNDGGLFEDSLFGRSLVSNILPLPPDAPLWNGASEDFPHYFVGTAAFPMKTNLMRPYPGAELPQHKAIFNSRLSRARRVIENSFGILTARWRVLQTVLEVNPENSEKIVLACLALHNFIMINDHKNWYCPETYVDTELADGTIRNGDWRSDLSPDGRPLISMTSRHRNTSTLAFKLRDSLADFFINEEAVPFQEERIT